MESFLYSKSYQPTLYHSSLDTLKHSLQKMPYHQSEFHKATPIYEELPGWKTDISGITNPSDLPKAAQNYIQALEHQCGIPISLIGVGPGRKQYINWQS